MMGFSTRRFLPAPDLGALPPLAAASARASAQVFGVQVADILGRRRTRNVARARFAATWIARRRSGLSYPVLGRILGRDHSSVIHACQRAVRLFRADAAFRDGLLRAWRLSKMESAP
jgi:chromosomal replication initiator protein